MGDARLTFPIDRPGANGALACCGDFSRSFAMSVSRVPARDGEPRARPFNYVRAVRGGF
jgi:hypothetical protein